MLGSRAKMALLSVIVLMFLCSSALWALDIAVLNFSIRAYFIDDTESFFSDRISKSARVIELFYQIQNVIYSFEVCWYSSTVVLRNSNVEPLSLQVRAWG